MALDQHPPKRALDSRRLPAHRSPQARRVARSPAEEQRTRNRRGLLFGFAPAGPEAAKAGPPVTLSRRHASSLSPSLPWERTLRGPCMTSRVFIVPGDRAVAQGWALSVPKRLRYFPERANLPPRPRYSTSFCGWSRRICAAAAPAPRHGHASGQSASSTASGRIEPEPARPPLHPRRCIRAAGDGRCPVSPGYGPDAGRCGIHH